VASGHPMGVAPSQLVGFFFFFWGGGGGGGPWGGWPKLQNGAKVVGGGPHLA
jgi:hypothetical protein